MMTRSEFYEFVKEKNEKLLEILQNKAKEYASTDDAFHNFNEGYLISTCGSPEEYAWNLRVKHLQSIKDFLTQDTPPAKSLRDEKLGDDILYGFIIWALTEKYYEKENTS